MAVAFLPHLPGEIQQPRNFRLHRGRGVQPAQPVSDFARVIPPDGVVPLPDAFHHPLLFQTRQASGDFRGIQPAVARRFGAGRIIAGGHQPPRASRRASRTTRAAVMSNCSYKTAPGAEAPKVVIPTEAPSSPT